MLNEYQVRIINMFTFNTDLSKMRTFLWSIHDDITTGGVK